MGQAEPTRQSDEILPPIDGSIVCLPVTTTMLVVDLTSMAQSAALPSSGSNPTVKGTEHTNPLGQYLSMIADGNNVYLAFADNSDDFGSINTTNTSTVTQSGAAAYQIPSGNTANSMLLLPSNFWAHFRMPPGPSGNASTGQTVPWGTLSNARYMGVLTASGTSTLRMWVSSR